MGKIRNPDRAHRVVGWLSAAIFFVFIGLPVAAVGVMGECLPRGAVETATCDTNKPLQLVVLLSAIPSIAALIGWLMFRLSRFFDSHSTRR